MSVSENELGSDPNVQENQLKYITIKCVYIWVFENLSPEANCKLPVADNILLRN